MVLCWKLEHYIYISNLIYSISDILDGSVSLKCIDNSITVKLLKTGCKKKKMEPQC